MTKLIIFAIILLETNLCFSQDYEHQVQIANPQESGKIIGQLGKPLGFTLTVQGVIVDNPSKGPSNGLNLVVQKINDSAIQELIKIPLSFRFVPKLEKGATYRLRVYETGEFVGIPKNAYVEAHLYVQTTGFYFQNRLVVLSSEKIKPIKETPNDFIGRIALLSGIAENENNTALINTSKGKLKLVGLRKWTGQEIGKLVEVYGNIDQTEIKDVYTIRNSNPRLVKLKDQIGMTVKLRGKAISLNGYWWFNYRGIDIYVEKMKELPNWIVDNHFRPMEVTGVLEQAVLPRIDQIGLKINPDSTLQYIVRRASWKPIQKLLAVEEAKIGDE